MDDALRRAGNKVSLTTAIAHTLEREDDALLLSLTGLEQEVRSELQTQREQFNQFERQLTAEFMSPRERAWLDELRNRVARYRSVGDQLVSLTTLEQRGAHYQEQVNPALRDAIAACESIRQLNFLSMEQTGILTRDQARRGTILVVFIVGIALVVSLAVGTRLARAILHPVHELNQGVEAIRNGDFSCRVPEPRIRELRQLAEGFNRMAATLCDSRASSLGELLQAKTTLEAILGAIPNAVIVLDPDRRVVTANPLGHQILGTSRLSGVPAGESTESTYPLPSQLERHLNASRSGSSASRESTNGPDPLVSILLHDEPHTFRVTISEILKFADGHSGNVIVLDDVTDLVRLDELRSELIAVASHELRTPLATLRLNLLMLQEDNSGFTSLQRELLRTAVAGTDELAVTIEEMLDLTRIESGQLQLRFDPVDLFTLLEEVCLGLKPRFADNGVEWVIHRDCPTAITWGDPMRLKLVLNNLLTNALKYSPEGGRVELAVRKWRAGAPGEAEQLELVCQDQGPGVPAEFRDRVFEKFFRVEQHRPSGDGGVRGTGIGLYVARQIIEAHDGRIWCEPAAGDQGTRFILRLPIQSPGERGREEASTSGTTWP